MEQIGDDDISIESLLKNIENLEINKESKTLNILKLNTFYFIIEELQLYTSLNKLYITNILKIDNNTYNSYDVIILGYILEICLNTNIRNMDLGRIIRILKIIKSVFLCFSEHIMYNQVEDINQLIYLLEDKPIQIDEACIHKKIFNIIKFLYIELYNSISCEVYDHLESEVFSDFNDFVYNMEYTDTIIMTRFITLFNMYILQHYN